LGNDLFQTDLSDAEWALQGRLLLSVTDAASAAALGIPLSTPQCECGGFKIRLRPDVQEAEEAALASTYYIPHMNTLVTKLSYADFNALSPTLRGIHDEASAAAAGVSTLNSIPSLTGTTTQYRFEQVPEDLVLVPVIEPGAEGNLKIDIRFLTGREIPMEVRPDLTVLQLKELVKVALAGSIRRRDMIDLIHKGKLMHNSATLSSYGLQSGSFVHARLKHWA